MTIPKLFFTLSIIIGFSSSAVIPRKSAEPLPSPYENLSNVNDYNHCILDYLNSAGVITYIGTHDESEYPSCADLNADINITMTNMYKVLEFNLEKEIDNPHETECLLDVFKRTKFLEYSVIATTAMELEANYELLEQVMGISKGIFVHATIQCFFSNNMLQDLFTDFSRKLNVTQVEYDCIRADVFERRLIGFEFSEVSGVNEKVGDQQKIGSDLKINEELQKVFDDAKRDFGEIMSTTEIYEDDGQKSFYNQVTPSNVEVSPKILNEPSTTFSSIDFDERTERVEVKTADDVNESIERGRKSSETQSDKSEEKNDEEANFEEKASVAEIFKSASNPQSFESSTVSSQITNDISQEQSKEVSKENSEPSSVENDRKNQKRNITKGSKSEESSIEIKHQQKIESSEKSQEAQIQELPAVTEIIPIKLLNVFKGLKNMHKSEEMTTVRNFVINEIQEETTEAFKNKSEQLSTIKHANSKIIETTKELKDSSEKATEFQEVVTDSETIEPSSPEIKDKSSHEETFEASTVAQTLSVNDEKTLNQMSLTESSTPNPLIDTLVKSSEDQTKIEETLEESNEAFEDSTLPSIGSSQEKSSMELEISTQTSSDSINSDSYKVSLKSSSEKLLNNAESSRTEEPIKSYHESVESSHSLQTSKDFAKNSITEYEESSTNHVNPTTIKIGSTHPMKSSRETDQDLADESPLKFDLMATTSKSGQSLDEEENVLESSKEEETTESSQINEIHGSKVNDDSHALVQEIKPEVDVKSTSSEDQAQVQQLSIESSSISEIDRKFQNLYNSLDSRSNTQQDFNLPIGDSNIKKRDLSQKSFECPSILAKLSSRIKNYNLDNFKPEDNECMSERANSQDVDDVFAFIVMQKIAKGKRQEDLRNKKFLQLITSIVTKYVDCTDLYGLVDMVKLSDDSNENL